MITSPIYYVYILQSIKFPQRYYVGFTENVESRLKIHNLGQVNYTKKYIPWKLVYFSAFANKNKALDFEKYLKSGSGRAFKYKRLV